MPKRLSVALYATAALIVAAPASATSISFSVLENNSPIDLSGQLKLEVTDAGPGVVLFEFKNLVGLTSSITDIYFYDGVLLSVGATTSSAGVSFSSPAKPANLPGYSGPPTLFYSTDSDKPVAANGIDAASEWLKISITLLPGKNINHVIAALADGSLKIGLKTQALADGESESYVNNPPPNVPDGGLTISLFGLALAGLGVAARRRR